MESRCAGEQHIAVFDIKTTIHICSAGQSQKSIINRWFVANIQLTVSQRRVFLPQKSQKDLIIVGIVHTFPGESHTGSLICIVINNRCTTICSFDTCQRNIISIQVKATTTEAEVNIIRFYLMFIT